MVDTYPELSELVEIAARAGVARLAPEELAVFGSVAEGWRRDGPPRPARLAPGGTIGFGVDAVLISEIALAAVTSGLGDVLAMGATAAGVGWWRRRRRPRPAFPTAPVSPPAAADAATTAATVPARSVSATSATSGSSGSSESSDAASPSVLEGDRLLLTDAQARALREACRRHAVTLGLTEEQGALLADAAVGALHGHPGPAA